MSEGSDKENKRVAEKALGSAPKQSRSFTSSLANLHVGDLPEESEEEEESITESTQEDKEADMALFGDQNVGLDVAGVYLEIESMVVSSKHYTSRDKQEILAQKKIWIAVPGLMLAKKENGEPDEVMVGAGIAAKRQMVLYGMVGKYGWEVALRTLKDRDGAALGLPEPVILPVTYVKAERSYNRYGSYSGGGAYVKQEYGAGRGQSFSRGRRSPRGGGWRK